MPSEPANEAPCRLIRDVAFGEGVRVYSFTNLYGCEIGDGTQVGTFVEIQAGAVIGARCKVQSHTFICEGITIGDEVFVGHGVMFINDLAPKAAGENGALLQADEWTLSPTTIGDRVSIGSGAVILGGLTVGDGARIGAGAVVTRDVAPGELVVGVPARAR